MQETRSIAKWEKRRDKGVEYDETREAARRSVMDSAVAAERLEALQWARENGVDSKWLDGSLRKLQANRMIRAEGYDPETGVKLQEYVTGGMLLDWEAAASEEALRVTCANEDHVIDLLTFGGCWYCGEVAPETGILVENTEPDGPGP